MNVPVKTEATALTNLPMMNAPVFEQMQRVGRMLAMSPLFPEHLRKGNPEQALANGVLVVNMAMRLNEDPLTIAQNIYFVGGKPGWSTSYLISKANQHGVFKDPIDWTVTGEGDKLSVTAKAVLAGTGKSVSYTCDMEMAKAEGWTKNAKYRSMPALMLRYRSAAALIRLYCPEVMIGVPAQIEVETGGEMRDVTPQEFEPAPPVEDESQDPEDAEMVEGDETVDEDGVVHEKPAEKARAKDPEPETKAEPEKEKPAATSQDGLDPEKVAHAEKMSAMILSDLTDAGDADQITGFYQQEIDRMKGDAPDVHAKLMEEIEAFKSASNGGA